MSALMILHPEVLKQYIMGKMHFMKMGASESVKYVESIKNSGVSYFDLQSANLGSVYRDKDAVRVGVKGGEISGLDEEQLAKIEGNLGKEFVEKIVSLFEVEASLEDVLYVVKNGEAHIPVTGLLRRGRVIDSTYQKWGWGSSTYNEIIVASQLADLDSRVLKVVYDYNTPGGYVDGNDQAGLAIAAVNKPTRGDVHFWAMSAGYWLLSQTDEARAMSPTVQVGSIGVAYEYYDWSKFEKDFGVELHTITSKNAPDKRPDTKRYDELLQKDADDQEAIFIQRVSAGRNKTAEHIIKNFGQGWDLIASDALAVGMIDKIEGIENIDKTINSTEGDSDMDLETLKKEHPAVYAEIFGAGKVEGQKGELARVNSHLSWMGKAKIETIAANIQGEKECDSACSVAYSDEHAAAVQAAARVVDDDGHEATSTADPDGAGAAAAGAAAGADGKDGMVDAGKLEASFDKLHIKVNK